VLFEDDRISEEIYREKLNAILGISADEALGAEDDLGDEGKSVLEVWERMDEGEIGSVAAGLDEADKIGERLREDSEGASP
jgi:hypothetical protein